MAGLPARSPLSKRPSDGEVEVDSLALYFGVSRLHLIGPSITLIVEAQN